MLITHLYVCMQVDFIFRVNFQKQKRQLMGLPWWLSGKNTPVSAEDTGSIPGPGRSHVPWSNHAHAPQLLSLCSGAREPQPHGATTEAKEF